MAKLTQESEIQQFPLFIDYGQRARDREYSACRKSMQRLKLREPAIAELAGFGRLIKSGLTDTSLDIVEDAFTPGRNMLFLLVGAAFAYKNEADAISIGLLNEGTSLFPDQTSVFLKNAEAMISLCMGRPLKVLAPLSQFFKRDVVRLAKEKGLDGTYSCHLGELTPCGKCIACREFEEA
jgi:7-cyano-7-deazaguanine synthase